MTREYSLYCYKEHPKVDNEVCHCKVCKKKTAHVHFSSYSRHLVAADGGGGDYELKRNYFIVCLSCGRVRSLTTRG